MRSWVIGTLIGALAPGCDTTVHQPQGGLADAAISAACAEAVHHSDFAWLRTNVLATSCAAFSTCHRGRNPPGKLNLEAEQAYSQLVGVAAITVPGWGERVVPGAPDRSYLMVKLTGIGGPLGEQGTTMPPNSPLLCREKIDAVQRWISAGAPGAVADAAISDAGADARTE